MRSSTPMREMTAGAVAPDADEKEIRVLLVDDQAGMRTGLRILLQLEANVKVIGEAGNAVEAESLAQALKPDLVIMDVEMPGCDGIAAASRCIDQHPQCLVIILTIHALPEVRARAIAAGAWAFVEKGKPAELRDAFRRASEILQIDALHSSSA